MPDRSAPPSGSGSSHSSGVSKKARFALLASVGIMFPVATAMGAGAGYWLDQKLGTFPWLSIVFFFFGIAAAFLNLFRTVRLFDRAE